MPSHYSSIGFEFRSAAELQEITKPLCEAAVPVETSRGTYLRWTSPSGAELWFQVDRRSNVVGAHPHFADPATVDVRIMKMVKRRGDSALDRAMYAWADAKRDPDGAAYPFVADCTNYFEFAGQAPPAFATVQIAAFAHELEAFESVEAFDASQAGEKPGFASQSFIPSGLFAEKSVPEATALFCGHVIASARKTNEITSRPFLWARVETYGATVTVVADPALIAEAPPVGGVVKGTFWLSAHLRSVTSEAGFLKRLRWRLSAGG